MTARRRAERVRSKNTIQAGFAAGDERFAANLADFSPFGLSVKTPHDVKPGTIYRLGIQVDTDYFRAAAVVRAKFPDGFAVEFLSMSPTDREVLRRLYLRVQRASQLPSNP